MLRTPSAFREYESDARQRCAGTAVHCLAQLVSPTLRTIGLLDTREVPMNDICRDTALVRMSEAAGFETQDQKRRPDPRWLEHGFFTCCIDKDGDIRVRDLVTFYIHPASEGLLLTSVFDFREGLDHEAMRAVHREVIA